MVMLPQTGQHAGDWGDMLNEYLLHEHAPDGTHSVAKILNVPTAAGQVLVSDPTTPKGLRWQPQRLSLPITVSDPSACERILWRAPAKARVTAVFGCRQGGVGATINAKKLGGANHLAHDLSLSTVDSWLDGGSLSGAEYNPGDTLVAVITNVSGSPSAVTIQIEVEYI